MQQPSAPQVLKLLAHDQRWRLLAALGDGDLRVHELMARVGEPANLVSYHLRRLRKEGLVVERRSSADARDVYYRLELDRLRDVLAVATGNLHSYLGRTPGANDASRGAAARPLRVLFVCTRNSARSQMAEAFVRQWSDGRLAAASAGTEPAAIHPLAVRAMAEHDIDLSRQRAKSLAEVDAESFDRVVTVCDRAREVCPPFLGRTAVSHWSVADPAAAIGSPARRLRAFQETARELAQRCRYLLATIESAA